MHQERELKYYPNEPGAHATCGGRMEGPTWCILLLTRYTRGS